MHIHSNGQSQIWTGVSGNYARKAPVSGAAKSGDTAGVGTVAKNPFADVLQSVLAPSGIPGSAFEDTLNEQLNLTEIVPVSRQSVSAGLQKISNQASRRPDDVDNDPSDDSPTPTSTLSTSTLFSTKGNRVNFFA